MTIDPRPPLEALAQRIRAVNIPEFEISFNPLNCEDYPHYPVMRSEDVRLFLSLRADELDAALAGGGQEDGIRYDAESETYVARHTILSQGRTENEAKAALASAIKLTAAYWPPLAPAGTPQEAASLPSKVSADLNQAGMGAHLEPPASKHPSTAIIGTPQAAQLDLEPIKRRLALGYGNHAASGLDLAALVAEVERLRSPGAGEARLYDIEQIKAAFWEQFHKSGELWFDYLGTDEDNEGSTVEYWDAFEAVLVRAGLVPKE